MSFQVFQAQGLRIYAGDTATVNSYTGLPNELAINTETKSVRVLDGVTPGGVPLTTTSGAELQGLNIEQLANLLVTAPQNGEALIYQDGKWTNQPVAASGGASHVNDLVDVKLTNLQTGEILSYNASISKWENKAVAAADHNHDTKYQAKGNYLTTTSNLGEINNVQITMPADGQSLVYDEGYQKWINTTLAGATGGGSIEPPSVIFVASHVYLSTKYYDGEIMGPWTIRHHNGDCFNTNGMFTAPKAGVYRFDYHNNHYDNESNSSQYIDWILNGSDLGWGRIYGQYVGGWENISGHLIIELAQGDTIQLKGSSGIRADGNVYGLWSGYLMHDPVAGSSLPSEITDPANGETLVYEDGKWVNQAAPETGIDGITSVDGKIGVNESSPIAQLHVKSEGAPTPAVFLTNTNADIAWGTSEHFQMGEWDGTTFTERMRINSSGNVGIGETNPLSKLHIENTSANDGIRIVSSATGEGYVIFGDTADPITGSIAYNHSSDAMTFDVNNAERMRIDSSGRLGIGTTAPAQQLHVSGSSPAIRLTDATATSETDGQAYLEFYQGSSDTRMGYVGYGSTASKHLYMYNYLDGGYVYLKTKGHGYVRIQTDYGYADLGPHNSSYFHFITNRGAYYFNRNCQAAGGFTTYSDERLKENVTVVENAVDALKKIRGVSFTWKKNVDSEERREGKMFGVLAQEVLQIDPEMCELPEAVNDGDEKFYTFDYSNLTPYFIEAIKEQQTTIESQQARIDSLEARLAALEAKLG